MSTLPFRPDISFATDTGHIMCYRHGALGVLDKTDPQTIKAGEISLRLRHKLDLLSSFEFGEQRSVRDCDFDNCGMGPVSPEVQLLVGAGVFSQDLWRNPYFGLLFVGRLADPVLEAGVAFV